MVTDLSARIWLIGNVLWRTKDLNTQMNSLHSLLHYKALVKHSLSKQDLHLEERALALITYYLFEYDYSTMLTPYPLSKY